MVEHYTILPITPESVRITSRHFYWWSLCLHCF
jgi:hypothetical protein